MSKEVEKLENALRIIERDAFSGETHHSIDTLGKVRPIFRKIQYIAMKALTNEEEREVVICTCCDSFFNVKKGNKKRTCWSCRS